MIFLATLFKFVHVLKSYILFRPLIFDEISKLLFYLVDGNKNVLFRIEISFKNGQIHSNRVFRPFFL